MIGYCLLKICVLLSMFLLSDIFYANVGVLSYFQVLLQFLCGPILLEDKLLENVRDFTLPPRSR